MAVDPVPVPDDARDAPAPRRQAADPWPVTAVLVVGALAPLVASLLVVAPGWLPAGDDATIVMRGRDLLTGETPLLGMPSAVGEQTGRPVHHPGPMQLWWVGAWERLLGIPQAALLAAALAWATATTATLLLARRIGGTSLLVLGSVVLSLLTWSLRGEVPVTPFNAHAIVVPLGTYVVALVAWHQRVRGAGLVAIVAGTWSAQAHLTAVGPVLSAAAIVIAIAGIRRLRSPAPAPLEGRPIAIGVAVLGLCWLGPLIDVITNGGGNVRAALAARSDLASEAIGPGTATDIVVRALAFRPVWASAGAHPSDLVVPADARHWAVAVAIAAAAVVGAIRRRHTHPAVGVTVGATITALVAGAVLAARFPSDYLSLLALHNHLWLWPFSALLWGAAAVAVALEVGGRAHALPERAARLLAPSLTAVGVTALVALGIASVGEPHRSLTRAEPTYVRALGDGALDRLDPASTYRVTISGEFDRFFAEVGLLAYLEGSGVDVVGPVRYRRAFGEHRTEPAGPVAGDLVLELGWDPVDLDGRGDALATHQPSPELLAERQAVEDRLAALIRRHPHDLPLWGMDGTDETELRRWLREDLDGFLLARLVPGWLAEAPETDRYLDLRRKPVLHASLHLVDAEAGPGP